MLNRAAIIIRYSQPFADWINTADPSSRKKLTLAEANDEATVYLIEVEDQEEFEKWLELNHEQLFEEELEGWYTEPGLWPQDRSLKTFKEWCIFEFHSVVIDTAESPLIDDEV